MSRLPLQYMVVRAASNISNTLHQYSLSADPASWGADLSYGELDDALHNPDPARDRKMDRTGTFITWRGLTNLGCLILLVAAILTLL